MPKVKAVTTLYSLSINRITSILKISNISVNVERSIQQATDSLADSDIISAKNPFHSIPTILLEAIISSLSINNTATTKPFNIEFLITAELKKLIFPRFYCFKNELYLNIFPKLEKLRALVLENSIADNTSLQLIGKWCKNLRILNLHECSRLSDIGIEWLVLHSSPELRKNLQLLVITTPGITKKGVKMAIQHFPALRIVENKHVFNVLIEVAQAAELLAQHQHPSHITSTYSITRLVIHISSTYRSGDIESVIKYCPSLCDIAFLVKIGLTDTDLSCLTNLKNLQILKFYTDPNSDENEISITFDRGLAPVFKVIGSTIKILELSHFEFVDIWTIVKFCPNLFSLNFENQCQTLSALSENEIIQLRNEKGRGIFKDLKILRCGFNLSNDILFDLLSCPSLELVHLTLCDALTEEFLKEAISYDLFKNLKFLKLDSCEFVTKEVLDELVMSDNNLEQISIHFCDKVTRDHVKDWHSFACHQNWKLYLSFEDDDTELITYNV